MVREVDFGFDLTSFHEEGMASTFPEKQQGNLLGQRADRLQSVVLST